MKLKSRLLTLLILSLFSVTVKAQTYRYTTALFPSSIIVKEVVYGNVPFLNFPYDVENDTIMADITMDIFSPVGDPHTHRPAIIFAHSGGFIIGNKNHDDMMALCDSLARRGYITATIDYRQGFNLLSNANMHGVRAAYRGLQDGRSAVRFMRAHAETYGVDPDKVYFVGSSAGAFIGLHSLFLDDIAEKPAEAGVVNYSNMSFPYNHTTPDLGGLDMGENLSYNGKPDALVSLWGAIQRTDLITTDNDTPLLLVHGDSDGVVPFETGSPFGYSALNDVFGSHRINMRLDSLGLTHKETYFVPGEGHEFYGVSNGAWDNGVGGNAYWDTIFEKITHFLWLQHKPTAAFTYSTDGMTINFTATATGAETWFWDFGDGTSSTEQNPRHTYEEEGRYTVKLHVENEILSWDEAADTLIVQAVSVDGGVSAGFSYYPNPTREKIHFSFPETYPSISIQLFHLSGALIREETFLNTSRATIRLEELPQNLYLIRIKRGHHVSFLKVSKQ